MKFKFPRLAKLSPAWTLLLLGSTTAFADSILRTAGDFTLLGGTAITSTGTAGTIIRNGNVGLYPGATTGITGFPPAVIQNGAIIATSAVTAQARKDLVRARVGLAGMRANANMSTVDLGGKTLAPGVYKFNSSASLNGNLVLDGQGKNNAFWVFQIGTALTTSINSKVRVINPGSRGGRDYGIFWNCGSAINIGGNNQIAGIYLAGTSITFGQGSFRGGRALALAGISLDRNQLDAAGGPGGSDWSGGLMFDRFGDVVRIQPLSFSYFGPRVRYSLETRQLVRGKASPTATKIQWRTNGRSWRQTAVSRSGRWSFSERHLLRGTNRILLRARDAAGRRSSVQRLTVKVARTTNGPR